MSAEPLDVEIERRQHFIGADTWAVVSMDDGSTVRDGFPGPAEAEEYVQEERPDLRLYKEPSE